MNQEVPHKKTNRDKKKGMNSTLLVFITVLMIERGEAYMTMEKIVAARPQKSFLPLPCKAKRETRATVTNTVTTKAKRPNILSFSFFGANIMNTDTYTNSIAAPVPFIVDTNMLFGDTNGSPYQAERRQLSKVMT